VVFAANDVALYQQCERQGLRDFITRCIEPYPDMDYISGFEAEPWEYLPP
jgi:hypothetical protein